jgi:hypothetical protein
MPRLALQHARSGAPQVPAQRRRQARCHHGADELSTNSRQGELRGVNAVQQHDLLLHARVSSEGALSRREPLLPQ